MTDQGLVVSEPRDIVAPFSMQPTTLQEAMEYAKLIANSEICPKEYRRKPGDVLIAIQLGLEVAQTSPLQSLQNIAIINGRATMWGDLVLAIVQRSGLMEYIQERDARECEELAEGRCEVKRKGQPEPVIRTFTTEMAEKAGLIKRAGPTGPWNTYRGRMLQMRARSWALRDTFTVFLKGLQFREEVEDYEVVDSRPIQSPRRLSEVDSGAVDKFIDEQKPSGGDGGSTGAQTQKQEKTADEWVGKIESVSSKPGSKGNRTWTMYQIKGTDGKQIVAFDTKVGEAAQVFAETKEEVRLTLETDSKGTRATAIVETQGLLEGL